MGPPGQGWIISSTADTQLIERKAERAQLEAGAQEGFASRYGGPRTLIVALAAAGAVAATATPLGASVSLIGAPIFALAIGMVSSALLPTEAVRPGLAFIGRYVLQAAIVLLGATIDLQAVASIGASSLPVMLSSLTAALAAAIVFGRLLGVPTRLRVLLGVGTGICGASAVATVSGVVNAKERELTYAVSTIFVFNLLAVLTFIPLAHLMGMSQHQFGLWDGTAVNDVSSVVAAGFAYGHSAGTYATIVKLTRTTMIIPITLVLAQMSLRGGARRSGSGSRSGKVRLGKLVPWFLVWFLLASAADTLGLWGSGARTDLSHTGLVLSTIALAAIGLSTDFGEARRTGHRPLILGAILWLSVSVVSLLVGHLTGGV